MPDARPSSLRTLDICCFIPHLVMYSYPHRAHIRILAYSSVSFIWPNLHRISQYSYSIWSIRSWSFSTCVPLSVRVLRGSFVDVCFVFTLLSICLLLNLPIAIWYIRNSHILVEARYDILPLAMICRWQR